ncbi:MAG: inositol monophosphatase [Planctomycetes bacterium]|nr:inositol monophosphatase [Planctomycetota bacterium]
MDTRKKEISATPAPQVLPSDTSASTGSANWDPLFTDSSLSRSDSAGSQPIDPSRALEVAIQAARAAGEILRAMLPIAVVREKSPKDLVTDADVAAQKAISKVILGFYPEHHFLGEEDAHAPNSEQQSIQSGWQWVVDPLDGTTNFAHGLRNFSVSIALMYQVGNPSTDGHQASRCALGVVYDPMADEMFTAISGRGATLNGAVMACSRCERLNKALVAASFPPQLQRDSMEIQQFLEILLECQSVRRLGSAALNLCYVGAGRLDAYWGGRLKAWDIAAGALIASEAGSLLSLHQGELFDPWDGQILAAATPALQRELIDCLARPTRSPAGR